MKILRQKRKSLASLIILIIIFGIGGAAILISCLTHKYHIKSKGYTRMRKSSQESKTDKQTCKDIDYISAYSTTETISDDSIYIDDDVNKLNQDFPENNAAEMTQESRETRDQSHGIGWVERSQLRNNDVRETNITSNKIEQISSLDYKSCEQINLNNCKSLEEVNSTESSNTMGRDTQWSIYMKEQNSKDQLENKRQQRLSKDRIYSNWFSVEEFSEESTKNPFIITDEVKNQTERNSSVDSRAQIALKDSEITLKEDFDSNEETLPGNWNSKKRKSIQAKVYFSTSDSDVECEVSSKLKKVDEESSDCPVTHVMETLSDTVMYFDYHHILEKRKSVFNKPSFEGDMLAWSADHRKPNIEAKKKGRRKSKLENINNAIKDNDRQFRQETLQSINTQNSTCNPDSIISCYPLTNEFSSNIIDDDAAEVILEEVMLNMSSSILNDEEGSFLRRSKSDSKLNHDEEMIESMSYLSLKSFSTSNLRGIHILPMPIIGNGIDEGSKRSSENSKSKKSPFKKFRKLFSRKKRKM